MAKKTSLPLPPHLIRALEFNYKFHMPSLQDSDSGFESEAD